MHGLNNMVKNQNGANIHIDLDNLVESKIGGRFKGYCSTDGQ